MLKKIPALVAAAVSAVLVVTMSGPATSAGAVGSADGSSYTPAPPVQTGAPERGGGGGGHGSGPGRYKVPTGAYFNNPRGSWNDRMRIERQVMHAIKATKKGAVIRIALYSFDRIPVAKALIAARQRGVHIQLLLNDHQDSKACLLYTSDAADE